MIEINKINKWYGDFHVLQDVDEVIEHGQTVVICGPSGSGKTAIAMHLAAKQAVAASTDGASAMRLLAETTPCSWPKTSEH